MSKRLTCPPISKGLLEYLEGAFPLTEFRTADTVIYLNRLQGRHDVLDHLRAVHEKQQKET